MSQPERVTKKLLLFMWDDVVTPLWTTRNDIYHHGRNLAEAAEDSQLTRALTWYLQHKREVLSIYDHKLIQFDLADLYSMPRLTKREWKRHLDAARTAWTTERRQRARSQQVITRFLSPPTSRATNVTREPTNA